MKEMPAVGYGTYPLRGQDAVDGVLMALELGYRHVDTARMYGNEKEVGEAIRRSGVARDDIFVTTKIWPADYAPGRFAAAARDSREALGVGAPDLLLLHWPPKDSPLEQALEQLGAAHDEGLARNIGVSNFGPDMMDTAVRMLPGRVHSNQVEFHPYMEQSAVLRRAGELGIRLVAYCPLAHGKVADEPVIAGIAQRLGRSAAQVTLRWILDQGITVIPKSADRDRAAANLSCTDVELSDDDRRAIGSLARPDGSVL